MQIVLHFSAFWNRFVAGQQKTPLRNSDATRKPTYVHELEGEIMKFTWGDLFTLLEQIWGMTPSKIAASLEVNRSTISRLISGEQKTFKRDSYTEVYRKLFAPHFANTEDENAFLREMKQELEWMKFGEIVKDLEGKDCKSFVIALLRMANENGAKGGITKDNPSDVKEVSTDGTTQYKPPDTKEGSMDDTSYEKASGVHSPQKGDTKQSQSPVPMYEYFYSELEGFSLSIDKFLNTDPVDFSVPADSRENYFVEDSLTFLGSINAERKREWNADHDGAIETYQSIISFIDALEDYLGFLQANSVCPEAFPYDFQLMIDDDEVVKNANGYHERAKSTFKSANAAVQTEREKAEQMRARCIHAGKYSLPSGFEERMQKFKAT